MQERRRINSQEKPQDPRRESSHTHYASSTAAYLIANAAALHSTTNASVTDIAANAATPIMTASGNPHPPQSSSETPATPPYPKEPVSAAHRPSSYLPSRPSTDRDCSCSYAHDI